MQERVFTLDDQNTFARLSGDHNALHVDSVFARRSLFGGAVVHGIHMVLWALDRCPAMCAGGQSLSSLKVVFKKSLLVGETVSCRVVSDGPDGVDLEVYDGQRVYTVISACLTKQPGTSGCKLKPLIAQPTGKVWVAEDLAGASGECALGSDSDLAQQLFPQLARSLPEVQIAEILATSRLVGMECPGVHSIFSGLDVKFGSLEPDRCSLAYKVRSFDARFSLLDITVEGAGMRGTIKAFLRPAPVVQAAFLGLRDKVSSDEFRGQKSLIVGGSRGLGEVVAKLLAAGGAKVLLTYHQGEEDARQVVREISDGGGQAEAMEFNVLDISQRTIQQAERFCPTHLYYFATPHISAGDGGFSDSKFVRFCGYYVSGFAATVECFLKSRLPVEKVFYPSTVFIDEQPAAFPEYVAAKSAGEMLCRAMEQSRRGLNIYRPRLPKMETDQTSAILKKDAHDPVDIMLEQLRTFVTYSR